MKMNTTCVETMATPQYIAVIACGAQCGAQFPSATLSLEAKNQKRLKVFDKTPRMRNMIRVTRRFQFCSGHRIYGHESKCAYLHGHNYVALVTARIASSIDRQGKLIDSNIRDLDKLGRVIDFGVLKKCIGEWIDENWDHTLLLQESDPLAQDMEFLTKYNCYRGDKPYLFQQPPTAEIMAHELLTVSKNILSVYHGIKVAKVVVWETENCYAEVESNEAVIIESE